MKTEIYNIIKDSSNGLFFKMDLYDYLHGDYLVGFEKRNPFLQVIDSLLNEAEANKKIILLNQTDI